MPILADAFLLVLSLSTDTFAASLAYGTNRIKIPFRSVFIISVICSGTLGLSMLLGDWLSKTLSVNLASKICFVLLFSIGVIKLFDSSIKSIIRKHNSINVKFTTCELNFVLTVYADVQKADIDNSKVLTCWEAIWLASALSIDSVAVGFGAAFSNIPVLVPTVISLVITIITMLLGYKIGEKIANIVGIDLSWLSGLLLVTLAFLKL